MTHRLPHRFAFLIAQALCALLFLGAAAVAQNDWQAARERMVREVIVAGGIENSRVREAMRTTPRHEFLPAAQRDRAYFDMALPIGGQQTITSPFVVARMTEALDPQPTDRVLEIGTGSGYQAAVLSPLVADVYSIEIVESLARRAGRTLRRLGYENVHTKAGDGYLGWPEHAPFDKIIVTCSPQEVPGPLVEQLREGGLIVVPLGERFQQSLYKLRKTEGEMQVETLEPTFFVPMTGRAEELRQEGDADVIPRLVNGSFEESDAHGLPSGWYYVRQADVTADSTSREGGHVLRLANRTPGQGAQALQALGMDGRQVREIEVSVWIRGRSLGAGQNSDQTPRIEITFYNQGRAPIESHNLGPWSGSFDWLHEVKSIDVPRHSRLAVLAVALYGGVGEMAIDQLEIRFEADE